MRYCVTVGYKDHESPPALITGPEVSIAQQEEALDALARKDDGAGYIIRALWYGDSGAPRIVHFSSPEQKAAREKAASDDSARHAAAERDKADQREALLKQAEALGFDPAAAAKAQAEADAARAEAEAAKAELEALKSAMTRTEQAVKLPETPSQETPVVGGEVHTLVLEGATPSPATNPTPTETAAAEGTPDAPEPPAAAPAPAPVTARRRP
jgi:hypothetical protein